jgi:hypothetical protein
MTRVGSQRHRTKTKSKYVTSVRFLSPRHSVFTIIYLFLLGWNFFQGCNLLNQIYLFIKRNKFALASGVLSVVKKTAVQRLVKSTPKF